MDRSETFRVAIRSFSPFERAIERQFAAFCAKSQCRLQLEHQSFDLPSLHHILTDGQGLTNEDWDVAFVVTDWLAEAVSKDRAIDLQPHLDRYAPTGYSSAWLPSLSEPQRFGDGIYGLPYHDGPECLIYRRDLFEDENEREKFKALYGYDLEPPRTWDQFMDAARFFTRPDHGLFGTVMAAFPDGHNTFYDFCLQLWSRGGDLTDSSGCVALDTPQAEGALEFYRNIVRNERTTYPGAQEIDSVRSGMLFREGRIALMVNWFGFAAVCEDPSSPVAGKVSVAHVPSILHQDPVSLTVHWVLAIAKGSPHRETALEFLTFVATPEMDKITTMEGAIGCRISTWQDAEVNRKFPYYRQLVDLNRVARTLPRSEQLPALVEVVGAAISEALEGQRPTKDILREAHSKAAMLRL